MVRVRVSISIRVRIRVMVRVTDCCIQIAGESDKMRICHVIKIDQWVMRQTDPHRPAPHFSCPLLDTYTYLCMHRQTTKQAVRYIILINRKRTENGIELN